MTIEVAKYIAVNPLSSPLMKLENSRSSRKFDLNLD